MTNEVAVDNNGVLRAPQEAWAFVGRLIERIRTGMGWPRSELYRRTVTDNTLRPVLDGTSTGLRLDSVSKVEAGLAWDSDDIRWLLEQVVSLGEDPQTLEDVATVQLEQSLRRLRPSEGISAYLRRLRGSRTQARAAARAGLPETWWKHFEEGGDGHPGDEALMHLVLCYSEDPADVWGAIGRSTPSDEHLDDLVERVLDVRPSATDDEIAEALSEMSELHLALLAKGDPAAIVQHGFLLSPEEADWLLAHLRSQRRPEAKGHRTHFPVPPISVAALRAAQSDQLSTGHQGTAAGSSANAPQDATRQDHLQRMMNDMLSMQRQSLEQQQRTNELLEAFSNALHGRPVAPVTALDERRPTPDDAQADRVEAMAASGHLDPDTAQQMDDEITRQLEAQGLDPDNPLGDAD